VVAREDPWITIEFNGQTDRFAFDWDEGYWYNEGEGGLWITIEEVLTAQDLLNHVAAILNSEDRTRVECPHCGNVSTGCDTHSRGCPRGELLELMVWDKATQRHVPGEPR
jgi:hypothetical protein